MCPCSKVKTVFGREFKSYFDSPVAYVFLVAFLVLVGFLTFGVAMFYERRQADLTPFFFWHPWVYPCSSRRPRWGSGQTSGATARRSCF